MSQPIVIDVTDDNDVSPEAAGASISSSLGDADPELKAALEASLQTLDEPVVDALDPRNEEKEQLFRAAIAAAERGSVTPVRAYIVRELAWPQRVRC